MADDTIIQEIITGGLNTLWNLLSTNKEESKELEKAYKEVKYGINIKYHINHYLKENIHERERSGEADILGEIYKIEEHWDEIEERERIARKVLLNHYSEDDLPYEGR